MNMETLAVAIIALNVGVLTAFARNTKWARSATIPLLAVAGVAPLGLLVVLFPVETLATEQPALLLGMSILSVGANYVLYKLLGSATKMFVQMDDLARQPRIHNKRP